MSGFDERLARLRDEVGEDVVSLARKIAELRRLEREERR